MSLRSFLFRTPLLAAACAVCFALAPETKAPAKEPWSPDALVEPKPLADLLGDSKHLRPIVIYVGFPSLYNGAHIRNSVLAGPGSKPEGIHQLRQVVNLVPRTKEIVIYCGCCPFDHCPNIRPAYSYLHTLGFTRITVLHVETNLHTDWVAKGFPTTKGPGL